MATKEAELFLECDQIRCNQIIKALEQQAGAQSIQINTFSRGGCFRDGAQSAYNRITVCAANEGFASAHFGMRSQSTKKHEPSLSTSHNHPDHIDRTFDEFDVVKKRKIMEADKSGSQDNTEALAQFSDFEPNTLTALSDMHALDQQNTISERIEMEEDFATGVYSKTGGVYIARTAAFSFVKIGATRRVDPSARLYELSRCVPQPFVLVQWFPSERPFALEAKIHRTFACERIKVKGAGTEFFDLSGDKISKFIESFEF